MKRTSIPAATITNLVYFTLNEAGVELNLLDSLHELYFNPKCHVIDDNGRTLYMMQLHTAPHEILTDAQLYVHIKLARLRTSAALCPSTPLASYADAPYGSTLADRLSRDR
jgi:hypothetical protein